MWQIAHVRRNREPWLESLREMFLLHAGRKEVHVGVTILLALVQAGATAEDEVRAVEQFLLLLLEAWRCELERSQLVHHVVHDQVWLEDVYEVHYGGSIEPED